jgi:hypothetical protein
MFNYDIFFDDGSRATVVADRFTVGLSKGSFLFYKEGTVVATIWTNKINAMIRRKG